MAYIRLAAHYRNVNGVQLAPGIYDVSDPVLRGLGRYLVESEQAEWADDVGPAIVVDYEAIVPDVSEIVISSEEPEAVTDEADSEADEPRSFGGKRRGR